MRDLADTTERGISATGSQDFPWSFPLWFTTELRAVSAITQRGLSGFTGRDLSDDNDEFRDLR